MQVCCVVKYSSDIHQDFRINEVDKYASKLGLKVNYREYDSWNYSDDREVITSLPAFHIYFDSMYIGTFYPGDNITRTLEDYIEECGKRELRSIRFLRSWRRIILRRWKSKID